MEEEERGGEGGGRAEKREVKLKRVFKVGKRSGPPSTPVVSSFQLFSLSHTHTHTHSIITTSTKHNQNSSSSYINSRSLVSVRKLGAALWELLHYLPLANMHRPSAAAQANGGGAAPSSRLRHVSSNDHHHHRHHHHHHHHHGHLHKDKGVLDLSHFLADNTSLTSDPTDQPATASSLRRHLVASLMQHHRTSERSNHALQPVSPASYDDSSMEVAPYNPAVTPTSSLDFKGRIGESHYNLKTSTELIKVLNRIWSLEEQHASNMSLIKALKTELDHSRSKVKELLRERQSDRHEIDDLVKQITEGKLARKSIEQDRIHTAVQSVREELEDERKLRKRSEGLHRKLARDLSEAKSTLTGALKELERERRSRKLLEDLCDEFAIGVKDYEQEVHFLKQKADSNWNESSDRDRLILHVSESWLDERMQMRIEEARCGISEKDSIVDKLRPEIEAFLQAKHTKTRRKTLTRELRHSLESVHLNEAVSGPHNVDDDEDSDSLGSDSNCFELQKPEAENEATKSKDETVKVCTPSSLQVKFETRMAKAEKSQLGKAKDEVKGKDVKPGPDQTSGEPMENNIKTNKHENNIEASSSNNFGWRNQTSPVRQWMAKLDKPESSSSKVSLDSKDNTLKAKLIEARSKGRRSRLRASKISC